jgi:hypothetical protein
MRLNRQYRLTAVFDTLLGAIEAPLENTFEPLDDSESAHERPEITHALWLWPEISIYKMLRRTRIVF